MKEMIQCNTSSYHFHIQHPGFFSYFTNCRVPCDQCTSDHDGPDWHEGGGVGAAGADQARLGAAAAGAHQDTQEEE